MVDGDDDQFCIRFLTQSYRLTSVDLWYFICCLINYCYYTTVSTSFVNYIVVQKKWLGRGQFIA